METSGWFDPTEFGAAHADSELVLLLAALCGLMQLLAPSLLAWLERETSAKGLTKRELDVLGWVAAGKTNAEAAELLQIAPATVKKHLEHIYSKLGAGCRTEAVAAALTIRPADRAG